MLVVGAFLLDDRTLLYMHVAETTYIYIYIYIWLYTKYSLFAVAGTTYANITVLSS